MKKYRLAKYKKSSTYTDFIIYESDNLATIIEVRDGKQWWTKTMPIAESREYAKNILAYKPNPMIPYDRRYEWFKQN